MIWRESRWEGGVHVINNLRYAADTVIIAESKNQLQQLIATTVVEESEAKGLFLNSAKSFTMVFSKSEVRHTCKITVQGNTLEQVDRFVYLESLFTSDGRCEQDVRQRIAIAKSAFTSLEKVLKNRNFNIQLRCIFLKCYVWLKLLYGSEAWTLSLKMLNKLEATEMWFLRRMQMISYTVNIYSEIYIYIVKYNVKTKKIKFMKTRNNIFLKYNIMGQCIVIVIFFTFKTDETPYD